MKTIKSLALCALLAAVACGPARAGQSCEAHTQTLAGFQKSLAAGAALRDVLDATGSPSALVARQGQDLGKYGLKYSHMGIAVKSGPGGQWRIQELLNACGTASSDLFSDGLLNFFLDDPFSYGFLVMTPPREVGARLAASVRYPERALSLHEPRYNMAAYPFSTLYQNSNQWVLEHIAAAESGSAATRKQAQAWLRESGYEPTELRLGTLDRLGGRMFKSNVAFDDHPSELRFAGRIRTVTVESVQRFLLARSKGWKSIEVDPH